MATAPKDRAAPADDRSLGELVASATSDLSSLMRQEVDLAKLEIKRDVIAAGKGAGAFGAAGIMGVLAVIFLSIAAAFGLAEALATWAGFLIVGGAYLLVALVAALLGTKSISQVGPPEHTLETVKDDISWAKHPTQKPGTV